MITRPMEKLLKKDAQFEWGDESQGSFDTLKRKMGSLFFLDWTKKFHVHVDASSITLGVVLVQPGEGEIDHLIYFSSQKFPYAE